MGSSTVGGYEIIRPLGAGGMGQVLLALDPKLERQVALKVLHRDFAVDPTARKRFHREAKSLASLSHPGIVTIHEIGDDHGRDFIVMEFLSGENLRSQISEGLPGQSEILAIAKQVAEAIAGAHGAGVLHRDIKPENIMVDADAGIKVVDFGLARSFDEVDGGRLPSASSVIDVMASTLQIDVEVDATSNASIAARLQDMELSAATETILGTPGYMAPELFVGESPTTASDIYSLGVMLYEMVAGKLPFIASSVNALLELRVYDDTEATRLDELPGVPSDVADLVAWMLKKAPEHRPSIEEVVGKIQAAQEAATQRLSVLEAAAPLSAGLSQEIDVFTPRRRRRVVQVASTLALCAALGAGVFVFKSGDPATTSQGAKQADVADAPKLKSKSIRIAMTPMKLRLRSYANANTDVSHGAATMLSTVLNRADAIRAIPPLGLQVAPHSTDGYTEAWHRAAKNAGAMYIATGTLSEEEGMLSGSFEITNMIDRSVETFSVSARSVSELDGLLLDLANRVVQKLVPGASRIAPLSAAQRSVDSLALYEDALIALNDSRWVDACLRLERIVKEQPKFFEAWYHLTIASAWAAQPTESALRAANKALSLAHTERDRRFIEVLIRYIKREQRTASHLAAELALEYPKDAEVAYIHAETVYHDGRHKEGLRLFNLALLLDPYSKIASVHPVEHAQAQGDFVKWQYFRTLRGKKSRPGLVDLKPTNRLRFALRHYEALAAQETGIDSIQALAILGRNKEADARVPTGETLKSQALLYALARAVEDGRKQDQEAYFKMVWRENSANADVAGNQLRVQFVIGVLVAAELREELQTFMGFWELPGARRVGSKESQLRAHAAIVLGDATMIRSEGFLSWREEEEATALRAELKGDHEEAARIWNVLLDDPGEYGDDMPRFALARNLFALGKSAELKAVCSDLVYPKFRVPAHPAHRMRCREWKALPGAIPAPTPLPATP